MQEPEPADYAVALALAYAWAWLSRDDDQLIRASGAAVVVGIWLGWLAPAVRTVERDLDALEAGRP